MPSLRFRFAAFYLVLASFRQSLICKKVPSPVPSPLPGRSAHNLPLAPFGSGGGAELGARAPGQDLGPGDCRIGAHRIDGSKTAGAFFGPKKKTRAAQPHMKLVLGTKVGSSDLFVLNNCGGFPLDSGKAETGNTEACPVWRSHVENKTFGFWVFFWGEVSYSHKNVIDTA